MHKKVLLSLFIFFVMLLLLVHCTKKPTDVKIDNQPPETFLVNVPPDSSYIHHARLIFWYGTDADGIVVRYDWAIDDTIYNANIAGSGWHSLYMDSTLATQDTIAFEAPLPDTIYTHRFYVRAVDNDGTADPTPAARVFSTSNIPPNTRFVSIPTDSSQRFILEYASGLWRGINFEWAAIDTDMVFPAQFQYLWGDPGSIPGMNDPRWSTPVADESFYFTGQNAPYEEGYHTVYVRAMDDAGSVDPSLSDTTIFISEIDTTVTPHDTTWDTLVYNQWVTLYFVIPEIYTDSTYRKLLWLNFATSGNNSFVKPWWYTMLNDSLNINFDSLNYNAIPSDMIDHQLLAQYSTLIWTKDDLASWPDYPLDLKKDLISDFLHVGGRIIFTGSKVLNMGQQFAPNTSFALNNLFPYEELHINQYSNISAGTSAGDTSISPASTDTAFYNTEAAYPHLYMSNNTSYNSVVWWNLVRQWFVVDALDLDLWGEYEGKLDIIYTINHHRDNALYEGVPCGTRFTYSTATSPTFFYFGFPFSYFNHAAGAALLRQVLVTELGE
jgi:hypothetical protein